MDSERTPISAKDSDDKNSSEISEVQNHPAMKQFLLKKLLTWGVELRGVSRSILDSEPDPKTEHTHGPPLDQAFTPSQSKTGRKHISIKYSSYGCPRILTFSRTCDFFGLA
jgi:hypothetical protein